MRFSQDVAIVTGGAQGIGAAIARALAAEGAAVAISDIDLAGHETARDIVARGGRACFLETDVASEQSAQRLVASVVAEFGTVHILVNNAALFRGLMLTTIEETSAELWDRVMAVNLRGPFLITKYVLPHMKRQRRGKIVNVSSNTVFSGGPGMSHYVASKAGIIGFTRCLAREAGESGICANVVAPGLTETEAARHVIPPKRFDAVTGLRSIARRQTPDDLVGSVLFLCSSDSDFVTGQVVNVDGGQIFC